MSAFYYAHLVLIQATLSGFVLALSIQVPLRMGLFSFAGAGSYAFGGYCCGLLILHTGMGALPAIALTTVATAVLGVLLGAVIYRLNGLYLAMATVAFDLIIGVVAVNGGSFTGSSTGLYGVIANFSTAMMVVLTAVALLAVAATEHWRTGRRIEAVREDPQLAASVGVNVRRYRMVGFTASGALGGLGGAMNVLVLSTIGPSNIGFSLIVLALTMIVVGGARSWKGAAIGAVIFTWLPDVLSFVGQWQDLVYGVIVALAAIFLPRGLHGVAVDVIRARGQRRRAAVESSDEQVLDSLERDWQASADDSASPARAVGGTVQDLPPVLQLRDVAVHFGGVKAVDGISLELRPGLIYGIIGPNGSGKSTLIGAVTRLTQLSRGELLYAGTQYVGIRASRLAGLGFARTFQTVKLLPELTVRANVQLGADARAEFWPRRGDTSSRVDEAIARAGLDGLADSYPSEFSYGTQRRVEIARALAMQPQLLLLDEPTAGMNQAERAEISQLLKSLRAGGLTQLLVEHDVQMMVDTCDYVFVMNSGQLIAEGDPAEIVKHPLVQEAYLGRKWREHAQGG